MPTVTDIRERRGIVEIEADGATVARLRRAHFAKCPAVVGEEIDVEAYLDRIAAIQFSDGYEAALSSLDFCARSTRDIAASLRRKGYVEGAVEAVVARLTENGLLDDARYAERMAELQASRPVGVYALKRRMRARGISEADAEAALTGFDDAQQLAAAQTAARSLARKYESLPRREARAKLSQALARRGFPWDAIDGAIDALWEEQYESD